MPGYDVVAIPVYETVAIYACVPLVVVLFFAALTLGPALRGRSRWKSGQPWEHEPVWFEPHPEHAPAPGPDALGHAEGHAGAQPADMHHGGTNSSALPLGGVRVGDEQGGGERAAITAGAPASRGSVSGASASGAPASGASASGASASGASAAGVASRPGGPLGGARGTW